MNILFKNKMKKIPFIVTLYRKIYSIYVGYKLSKKEKIFTNNSDETIVMIQNILTNSSVFFFFDMGTLLGIYRDGKLIKRDMDIDIGVQLNNKNEIVKLRKMFIEKGFIHKFIFSIEKYGVIQDTYEYHGVSVDVCYYRTDGDFDTCYLLYDEKNVKNLIVKLSCHHIQKIKQFTFNNKKINIPYDTEQYLSDRYGENWRTPNQSYIYWKGPSTEKIPGNGFIKHLTL